MKTDLTARQITRIRWLRKFYGSELSVLANTFSVSVQTITRVINKEGAFKND